ncbi:5-oxoprolinase subunit PxpA [Emcibacter nanhaiensis]|uniref:5-oxoprolinase subunit PxpA n=1 Tax=Emcibacter nanhaiensis TaxID=1505037 RepID=A0A501PKA7_9PROT|nr:5-oxoprolinase subunit PxpA [Emcibacter nanhaiensis]TPD60401.1 5-oxoprolinase subunit PxpA [Emcibacter nanhaiensis]
MSININCDMGEGFGLYQMGDDEAIMPYVTEANIACGFHASDPGHMHKTVLLAKSYGVKIGAHFSLPDLQGFGRREMKVSREEIFDIVLYQVGALIAFLDINNLTLNHLKPHGALYGMAARQQEIAEAIADVAEHYQVSVFGLAGTLHEEVYKGRGLDFVPEFYADLEYDRDGHLVITRSHDVVNPSVAAARCLRAVMERKVATVEGADIDVQVSSVCVHSDTPNSVEVAKQVREVLSPYMPATTK